VTTIQTADQLFPHECQESDMRFSAFNPETVSYYCTECGGKLVVRVKRDEWPSFFDDNSLSLNPRVLARADLSRQV
jgi:hypothetical protein